MRIDTKQHVITEIKDNEIEKDHFDPGCYVHGNRCMGRLRPKTIFVYGFAASFNDSTVYFTDIQQVDSAYIDSKTKFLYSRENYSYQLRDYLAKLGFKNATCVTSFSKSKKEAEKKYLALRKKYLEGGKYNINYLKEQDFRYQAISGQIEIGK